MNLKTVLSIFVLITVYSCAVTQNPIYTKTDLVEPEGIVGAWRNADNRNKWMTVSRSKTEHKAFHLTQEDPYTIYYYNCRFVKFGGVLFADIETADSNFKSSKTGHLILKVAFNEDTCKVFNFQNLSPGHQKIRKSKIAEELDIHFAPMDKKSKDDFMFDDDIITDPTARLQKILAGYSTHPELINPKPVMIMVRQKQQ